MWPGTRLGSIFSLVLSFLGLRRIFRVEGESMAPTFREGDLVVVNPFAYQWRPPCPGEVVVTRHPYRKGAYLLKRVAAYSNGRLALRGDNAEASTDSRSFGWVGSGRLMGRVERRFGDG